MESEMSPNRALEGLQYSEALEDEGKGTPPSDLVHVSIPLRIAWISKKREQRTGWAKTLVVNRRGATIAVDQKLDAVLEISIGLAGAGQQTVAHIFGTIGQDAGKHIYAVELADPSCAPWLPELLNAPEVNVPATPFYLECAKCLKRAQVELDSIYAYVFNARRLITLPCSECGIPTTWGLASYDSRNSRDDAQGKTAEAPRTENQRRHNRISTKLSGCLRSAGGQFEEIVRVRDFSKGGFRFRSPNHYPVGLRVMAAMPFTADAANVFVPIRIIWRRELKHLEKYEYGVSYEISDHTGRRK